MRKLISAALLGGFVTIYAVPVLAQTSPSSPAPTGPTDCKANEMWDQATKRCVPKS
jgi:hypothetical protein